MSLLEVLGAPNYAKMSLTNYHENRGIRMLRIAICDDDALSVVDIKNLIESWSVELAAKLEIDTFDNGDSLLRASDISRYDIIFLDIVMPLLNGIDTAKELRDQDKSVKIVFLTSSTEFALQSYSVKATDYCIKPITYQKLSEVMDDCTVMINQEPEYLTLKTVGGFQKIYLHEIEYVEAQNKRVFFFLRSGQEIEILQPLYTFENVLTVSKGFFKCHRSYLVYMSNVDYFNAVEIKTKAGRRVPIARGYGKAFQDAYFSAMFNE
jgi:DNA-binding LytR/AlgR family response regulator